MVVLVKLRRGVLAAFHQRRDSISALPLECRERPLLAFGLQLGQWMLGAT
jgi:hypothetical protein